MRSAGPMKRVHDDISVPTDGNVPGETSAGVAAENGPGKAGNSALSPGPAGGGAGGGAGGHSRKKCPYLDTINRNVLDFDFEKVRNCSPVPWCCLLCDCVPGCVSFAMWFVSYLCWCLVVL